MLEKDENKKDSIIENKKENSPKFLKQKSIKIVLSTLSLLALCLVVIAFTTPFKNNTVNEFSSEYEILDESVILEKDILNKWIEENAKGKGGFYTSDEENTYMLISNGVTTQSSVGICLEGFEYGSKIEIKYSIIKNNGDVEVEAYTPKMLLKIPKTSKKITFTEIDPT